MYNVIIDCNPGQDDAIALLLASRADDIRILGVTTVAGNGYLENTTQNARTVLDFAGATDVDVYPGCEKPMMRELWRLSAAILHGEDGLGGSKLPDPVTPVKNEHAVSFIIRALRESEERITLIVTGPATNIAQTLVQAPDVKENIDRIVLMGGAIRTPGNVTSAAEFNMFQDPEAAKILLASGLDLYLVTLDASMNALFSDSDIRRLRGQGDELSAAAAKLLDFSEETHMQYFGFPACPVHGALSIASLIDQDLIGWEYTFVDVSACDELTRGETVADLWGITGRLPNCHIAAGVDRDRFADIVIEHLKRPYVSKR
jgi:inosine-uridine nucleoside N-ribohydrolase